MSLNFKLAYNEGFNYTDLFPRTTVEAIKFNTTTSKHAVINVTIPASNDLTQTIPISTMSEYLNVPTYMVLLKEKDTDEYDYSTISQFNVTAGNLEITRLYAKPVDSIQVVLVFMINSKNILSYSEVNVSVPQYSGVTQVIPVTLTTSQALAPFSVELASVTEQSKQDYATISQIQVNKDSVVITRLGNYPIGAIDITLRFKEGGI